MIPCALLLGLAGTLLVYLASARQTLLAVRRRNGARTIGLMLMCASVAVWIAASGAGAGIAAALTTWMLGWVALPYLAWWRQAAVATRADGR